MERYQRIVEGLLQHQSKGLTTSEMLSYLAIEAQKLTGEGTAVSILLIDENGVLRNGASPDLPHDYLEAIDGIRPHPNVGTCAAAAATGEIIFTDDFLADNKWTELKHLPMSLGFSGAWSVPIKNAEGTVMGTMGVYERQIKRPESLQVEGIQLLTRAAAEILQLQKAG